MSHSFFNPSACFFFFVFFFLPTESSPFLLSSNDNFALLSSDFRPLPLRSPFIVAPLGFGSLFVEFAFVESRREGLT